MLAARRRAVHYVSAGVHEESRDGEAERGDVPHAGLRRAHDGNALANAKAWSRTFPASESEESRRENSGQRGDWRRSGDGALRDAANSRSEEHTSELSHRCMSYAVFCLKKKIREPLPDTHQHARYNDL